MVKIGKVGFAFPRLLDDEHATVGDFIVDISATKYEEGSVATGKKS